MSGDDVEGVAGAHDRRYDAQPVRAAWLVELRDRERRLGERKQRVRALVGGATGVGRAPSGDRA